MQWVFLYVQDDITYYGGPIPILKDQRELFPEVSNPLLVDILDRSDAGQHFLKEEVIQF